MSLIAAVICNDGIAIAADSQETVGDYRRTVQKITPFTFPNCKVVVAGAGNGDLIYTFRTSLQAKFSSATVNNIAEFIVQAETILREFYDSVVSLYPAEEIRKDMYLFLAASIESTGEYSAWVTNNTCVLSKLEESQLLGWEETLYYRSLQKMSSPTMPLAHAVLVAIHTLIVGEETSNYVRGPMSVSVVSRRGIFQEPDKDVEAVVKRLRDYEDNLSRLFLLYSDVTTSSIKFRQQLEDFSSSAIALREAHVEAEINRLFADGFDTTNWAYQKFPKGVAISMSNFGEITVLQGKEREEFYRRNGIDISKVSLEEWGRLEWKADSPEDTDKDEPKE